MAKSLSVAVAGATGAVGREFLAVLDQRRFPIRSIRLLASTRSAGTRLPFAGEQVPVEVLQRAEVVETGWEEQLEGPFLRKIVVGHHREVTGCGIRLHEGRHEDRRTRWRACRDAPPDAPESLELIDLRAEP